MDYRYPLNQCDVPPERRSSLESYRSKLRTWVTWIDNDDHHAIWMTISAMIWNDVSFRTLADLALADEGSPLRNSLLAEKLINGHVATQVLAIRRLMDRTRGTISLRRLIVDIRSHYHLFTRENYVCHDGLPYDYEAVMQREFLSHAGGGSFWAATTGPEAWATSQLAHERFDKLANTRPDKRNREDRLPRVLLDTLDSWLEVSHTDDLADWSDVYLAHAGSAQNRQLIADAIVTNDKITNAIRTLARVTEAISAYLLFSSGRLNSLMPTAQFNQFENLDRTILRSDQLDHARSVWKCLSDERDQFLEGVDKELSERN